MSILEHNKNLIAWVERLMADAAKARSDLRSTELMARRAIEDRLAADKRCWALRAEVDDLRRQVEELRARIPPSSMVARA